MNLPKIRASFAAIAVAIAYLVAPSASAAILATNNFETACDGFVADIGGEDASAITAYDSNYPSTTAPYPFTGSGAAGFGSNYLKVDTGDATIFREFATQTSSTYLDTFMQFEPTTGEISYTNAAKIVVYLDAATSNLCVISGTSADNRTPVTNRLTSAVVEPGTWGRLTIKCLSGDVFSFQVLLNGAVLSTDGSVDTFYSLKSGATVSRVGFKGTGALDDFVARTTDPYITPGNTKATCNGESYATVEQALDEANGTTVALAADHADTVSVTKSGTYVVDKSSYTFGGIVGKGTLISASTVGTVTTYTATAPTAVWDCAVAGKELNTTQGGLTISTGYNNSYSNGKIVLAGSDNSGCPITLPGGVYSVSVLVKYSNFLPFSSKNMTYPPVFASAIDSDNHEIGLYATNNASAFRFYWQQRGGSTSISESDRHPAVGPDFPSKSYGYFLFAYSASSGVRLCLGDTPSGLVATDNSGYHFSNKTISSVSIGGAVNWSYNDGWPNFVIEKVALFTDKYLTAEDVADYIFPSQEDMIDSDVTVSELNEKFGLDSEISIYLADGVVVTGDTTFNASTVHFACDGSFTMTPPAGNTTTFDFSGVSGKPVIKYATLPTVSGSVFTSETVPTWVTDSTKWSGVIYISSGSFTDFTSNAFGNESSAVRLGNVSGWLRAPDNYAFTNSVPVELVGTLIINNGNSANDAGPNRCTVFKKLSGSGTISTDTTANKVVVVIQDASEFTGNIGLNGKLIVFGDAMPSYTDNNKFDGMTGSIWIMEGASVTANPASGNWWAVGGIKVYGELRSPGLGKFGGGTNITTFDTGIFTLLTESNIDDLDVSYARISGTGTLRYEGSGYRTISRSNFPTTMTVENNLEANGLIHRVPGAELTIGSLAGNGRMRSDWGGTGSTGDRDLRILQATNTTYSGLFDTSNDRIRTVYVAPGASSAGTLTLSNTQTASNDLVVESEAKVNLTGTWVGAVTVAGTLGGTGNVTGNVTLSNGAKLKVDDMSDTIEISGSLTVGGTVDVYLPAGTVINKSTQFITTGSAPTVNPGTTFNVYIGDGAKSPFRVAPTENGLKLYRAPIVFLL